MINEDDIIEKHMRIAFSDMTDFVEWGNEKFSNYVKFKDSNLVDGGLIKEIKQGKDGASIKLEDRQKSLDWLSNFFEMNPNNRYKKEFDKERLRIQKEQFEHNKEIDKKRLELEEKKINTDTEIEETKRAIKEFIEVAKSGKEDLDELFEEELANDNQEE